jgi:hypothetical protein
MEPRYTVDENQIVFEVLDQEVMVVNLDTGYYYALEGTAVEIWQAMAAGATAAEAAEAVMTQYEGTRPEVAAAIDQFVAELLREALLIPAAAEPGPPAASGAVALPEAPRAFTQPVMYKYADMANLIQMDPIREFDENGWPKPRPAAPKRR